MQQTVQTPVQRIAVRTIIQIIILTAVMLEQERAMEVRSSNNIEASPMELYIHIPFCIRKAITAISFQDPRILRKGQPMYRHF